MTNSKRTVTRRSFLKAGSAALLVASGLVTKAEAATRGASLPEATMLVSGNVMLSVRPHTPIRLSLTHDRNLPAFQTSEPLNIQLLDKSGQTTWLSDGYTTVTPVGTAIQCAGDVRTSSGSVFHFTDVYKPVSGTNAFLLERDITVQTPSADDVGFLSRFSLCCSESTPLHEYEFFVPGIWYRDNQFVPRGALASDLSDDYFIVREDRMPLPLVMMRNKQNGTTMTLSHSEADGSTCLADYTGERVIDERIQVASLGVFSQENTAVAFYYPAAEGERTYFRRSAATAPSAKQWVERFHPVQVGVKHSYKIVIDLSAHLDFPNAMRHAWRIAFAQNHHPIAKVDVQASYEASIKLIADWSDVTNGAPGIPFRLRLPKGELISPADINYQMGFVGQQLPLAYHLLRYGLLNHKEEIQRKGEAMVDFWAANSLTSEGLPRTWYDTYPEPHWRRYNTFMRVASDGMIGALMAWDIMKQFGHSKSDWLTFCTGFGDWLVQHQNSDGSWYREYDWDSKPVNEGKQNTAHPIRFLLSLFRATKDPKYRHAARHAGDWCYSNVHQAFAYVGGTADNPNVIDREAGFITMESFLALHDATGEKRWLDAAGQAGDFTETWVYSWNIPIPSEDRAATYHPTGGTTTGLSIIATGHSGADLFMAGTAFSYYRLYLSTGDTHYADMARQLLYDTKHGMDIDGSLGYGHTGLCTEALTLAPPRGHGVNTWLPWLTYSMIEPIVRLQEAYGMMDIPTVQAKEFQKLRVKDRVFARTAGLGSVNLSSRRL